MAEISFLRGYQDWKDCITVACGIALTPQFIAARLAELSDPRDAGTQRFVQTWGSDHLARVQSWFRQAAEELQVKAEDRA